MQSKGNHGDVEITEEVTSEKLINAHVSISRLPLVLSEKVQRSKALVECEGESIDLSGEMGAVGRPVIPDTPSGDSEMHLDLKGTIYRTTTVPSRTFYVVCQGSLLEFFINNCPLFTFPSPSWSPMISMGSVLHFTFERDDCVI